MCIFADHVQDKENVIVNMVKAFYDAAYTLPTLSLCDTPDEEVCHAVRCLPEGGKGLDIGCGLGRNTLFLASNGFHMKCIDLSDEGIKALKESAQKTGLIVDAVVGDIRHELLDDDYAIALCTYSLHHMPRELSEHVIKRMQDKVLAGGINVIATYTAGSPLEEDEVSAEGYFYKQEEILSLYQGWKILARETKKVYIGFNQYTEVISLVAQKPN